MCDEFHPEPKKPKTSEAPKSESEIQYEMEAEF
jgi:hypothetical protein